jgi:hypothetical protein
MTSLQSLGSLMKSWPFSLLRLSYRKATKNYAKMQDTRLPTAVCISHVCQRWRAISLDLSVLWKTFYFSYNPDSAPRTVIARFQPYMERSGIQLLDLWFDLASVLTTHQVWYPAKMKFYTEIMQENTYNESKETITYNQAYIALRNGSESRATGHDRFDFLAMRAFTLLIEFSLACIKRFALATSKSL